MEFVRLWRSRVAHARIGAVGGRAETTQWLHLINTFFLKPPAVSCSPYLELNGSKRSHSYYRQSSASAKASRWTSSAWRSSAHHPCLMSTSRDSMQDLREPLTHGISISFAMYATSDTTSRSPGWHPNRHARITFSVCSRCSGLASLVGMYLPPCKNSSRESPPLIR